MEVNFSAISSRPNSSKKDLVVLPTDHDLVMWRVGLKDDWPQARDGNAFPPEGYSHVEPNIYTPESLQITFNERGDPSNLTAENHVITSIMAGVFNETVPIILRDFRFALGEGGELTIPANVTLEDCVVLSGTLSSYGCRASEEKDGKSVELSPSRNH